MAVTEMIDRVVRCCYVADNRFGQFRAEMLQTEIGSHTKFTWKIQKRSVRNRSRPGSRSESRPDSDSRKFAWARACAVNKVRGLEPGRTGGEWLRRDRLSGVVSRKPRIQNRAVNPNPALPATRVVRCIRCVRRCSRRPCRPLRFAEHAFRSGHNHHHHRPPAAAVAYTDHPLPQLPLPSCLVCPTASANIPIRRPNPHRAATPG